MAPSTHVELFEKYMTILYLYGCLWTCSDSDISQISCGYSVRGWLSYGTVDLKYVELIYFHDQVWLRCT